MTDNRYVVGVLLAGGMSSRYGSPKAFARLNGVHFYEIAYRALERVCQHVIIVTRQELINCFPSNLHVIIVICQELINWFLNNLHLIVDHPLFVGDRPLVGIYSAMEHVKAESYVVLPCDMPLITTNILEYLIERHQDNVSVAVSQGQLQPLVSVWNYDVKDNIYTALESGQFKMKDFLSKEILSEVIMDHLHSDNVFMNINTPENKKELRKWKLS